MTPHSYWLYFHVAILLLMAAEFGLHRLFPDPRRKALYAIILWTVAALAFAGVLVHPYGTQGAVQYVAGWALEEALSIDNLFVFLLLFRLFRIPANRQPKVLFWGVAGAIVMRGAFILGGVALLAHFAWVEYVFAAILLVAAFRLLKPEAEETEDAPCPTWLRWLTRLHPVADSTDTFLTREPDPRNPAVKHLIPTLLLLSLIAVELTDVVFALDSIPAVLSITRNPFIAYTSNIMAVMGLRSLYVLLAVVLQKLRFMHFGLAAILAFAAVKMLLTHWLEIGPVTSLAVIALILAVTIATSLMRKHEAA